MNYGKKLIRNERIGEQYYYIKHPSGLDIIVMEMEGFSTAHALFATKYGSINTTFKTDLDEDFVTVPEGIAHFLEHKLFENEDCDVFELYAKTGASGNAYTSFDRTAYLFTCTDNFKESLAILLDFVQKPYFTKASVDKEQGIIGQEIKMGEDNPYRNVFFNMLGAVYEKHPVRIDIAGTVESIAKIDADLLYRCYNTFYNLNNMVLAVAGNCKVDEVLEVADKLLKPCEDHKLESVFPSEPGGVFKREVTQKMAVGTPLFAIGYKTDPAEGVEMIKKEYISAFLLDMIFGASSRFYKENTDSGLINKSFETETDDGYGFFVNVATGESREPKKVLEKMNAEIASVKAEGLDVEEFEALKKYRYSSIIRGFNNVTGCATQLMNARLMGYSVFDPAEVLASLTFEDVISGIDDILDPDRCAISIIEPIE